jgi:hypothetical protein
VQEPGPHIRSLLWVEIAVGRSSLLPKCSIAPASPSFWPKRQAPPPLELEDDPSGRLADRRVDARR